MSDPVDPAPVSAGGPVVPAGGASKRRERFDGPPPSRLELARWVALGLAVLAAAASIAARPLAHQVGPIAGPLFAAALVLVGAALGLAIAARPRENGRRVAVGFGAPALVVTPVLLSGCLSRPMIFPGCDVALDDVGAVASDGDVRARVVGYTTDDGLTLKGALVTGPRSGPRPAAIYFHGNAESAAQNVDVALELARRGVDCLVAEYRGYGGCPGSPSEEGLLRDARAALACLERETGVAAKDVVLVGRSLGTGVAAAMAAEGRGRALVLISPYTSILDLAAALVSWPVARLAVVDTFLSLERLLTCAQPVVVLHGTHDEVIPFAHGQEIAAKLGAERCRLVAVQRRGHNDLLVSCEPLLDAVASVTSAAR